MRTNRVALAALALLVAATAPASVAFAEEDEASEEAERAYDPVGRMECEPEGRFRWWLVLFSRTYWQCSFERHDGATERYRGRSGVRLGGDFQRKAFAFDVFVSRRTPPRPLAPYELAGEYRAGKMTPDPGQPVSLRGGEFKLAPVYTGVAVGWVYMYLEAQGGPAAVSAGEGD